MEGGKSLLRRFALLLAFLVLIFHVEDGIASGRDRHKQFLASHTVDPALNPSAWNGKDWTDWLGNTAEQAYVSAGGKPNHLINKSINTVIVANPDSVKENFIDNQPGPVPDGQYGWSREPLDTFVIQRKKGGTHETRKLPAVYSRVAYEGGKPVHYGGFDSTPVNGSNPNYSVNNGHIVN